MNKAKLSPNQFWKLVHKVTKKEGGITAIKDNDGILHMDYQRIEQVVIEELAKIFSGSKSKICTSRNEQIIKEMSVKESLGWEKWIPKLKSETEYEGEICTAVSMNQEKSIIRNLKEGRSSRSGRSDYQYAHTLTNKTSICI